MWKSEVVDDNYMDTKGAGAGSYPEPPEQKDREYIFTCECYTVAEIRIMATSKESALQYVENGDYDSLEIITHEVENIIDCKTDDE